MTKLTINKAAIAQLAGNTKVRARIKEGVLQLRPTARKSGVKLPKGEKLIDVKRGGIFNQIDLQSAFGDVGFDVPTRGFLVPVKHGWLTLAMASETDVPTCKAV